MKKFAWACLLLTVGSPTHLAAGLWGPVPASVWEIKEETSPEAAGAVILEDWSRYGIYESAFRLRILILNAAGKAAVHLASIPNVGCTVKGRTLYPDGRETPFDRVQDLTETLVSQGSMDKSLRVIVPPGLTDHCLVDVYWTFGETYLMGNRLEVPLLRALPIREREIQLDNDCPLGTAWLKPDSIPMAESSLHYYQSFKFRDLPALKAEPYSRKAWSFSPRLIGFHQNPNMQEEVEKGPDAYWKAGGQKIVKPEIEDELRKGGKFPALAKEILEALPEDKVAKALAIYKRLSARVKNINMLTYAEKNAWEALAEKPKIAPHDLGVAAAEGWTNGDGMFLLLYQLFKQASLNPRILFVPDRDMRVFSYSFLNFFQFDNSLLGIDAADGKTTLWLDPRVRLVPPGIINASYQGMEAMAFASKDWSAHPCQVPVQAPDLNRTLYQVVLVPGEDRDLFKLRASFTGLGAWAERGQYFRMDPEEARKSLKEVLEKRKTLTLTRTNVLNATEPDLPLAWEAEGTRESSGGRRRQLYPFPGTQGPLWIPSSWPDHRLNPVVMPYLSTFRYTCKVLIPEGWTCNPPEGLERSNAFGKVSWQVKAMPEEHGRWLQVAFEVVVAALVGEASSEAALRDFLSWVQDGYGRSLNLEKAR